jgi:hypothetical protein
MNAKQFQHSIPLPALSDEAAVEILNFLEVTFQIFETHYAGQIHRFYESISQHNIVQQHPFMSTDDPPF